MKSRKMVLPIPFEDGAGDGPGMVREDGARGMVQGWCGDGVRESYYSRCINIDYRGVERVTLQ